MNHIEKTRLRTVISPSDTTQTPRMAEAVAWCGVHLTGWDWAFVDRVHAEATLAQGDSITVCPACLQAARDATP